MDPNKSDFHPTNWSWDGFFTCLFFGYLFGWLAFIACSFLFTVFVYIPWYFLIEPNLPTLAAIYQWVDQGIGWVQGSLWIVVVIVGIWLDRKYPPPQGGS